MGNRYKDKLVRMIFARSFFIWALGTTALVAMAKDTSTPPSLKSIGAMPMITANGSKLFAGGKEIRLRGANIPDPLYTNLHRPGMRSVDLVKKIKDLGGNLVRIAIHPHVEEKESFFKNRQGYYRDHLLPVVQECAIQKMYCILDLHFVADFEDKKAQVLFFWAFMVEKFANHPHLLFEIYNEPVKPYDWKYWRDFIAQPTVELIRKSGAKNLIIVGGPKYNQIVGRALKDPIDDNNIAYAAHIYPNTSAKSWDRDYRALATKYPVIVTEWGFQQGQEDFLSGTKNGFGRPLTKWMDSLDLSWTAWVFDNRWTSSMVDKNWQLTKGENGLGEFVKEVLSPAKSP